jgi:predicted extracellular nuclease
VSTGDWVQLTATVTEYNVGASNNADTAAHTVTELTGPTALSVLSSGNTITPLAVTLPEAVNDDLERYEGMLVTLQGR